ncbi:MAG TPA: DUF4333 domain-containing protein [Acidimicrobiales bacterium]|nr:DUF4333 domain-containing protein [Acidimicrobiales bacterium]
MSAPADTRPLPRRKGYLLPGAIALVVLAAIAVVIDVAGLQSRVPRTLNGAATAQQVAQAIETRQGLTSAPSVHCPASEPVRAGLVFYCTLDREGHARQWVRISEYSNAGDYHVAVLDYRPG